MEMEGGRARVSPVAEGVTGIAGSAVEARGDGSSFEEPQPQPTASRAIPDIWCNLGRDTGCMVRPRVRRETGTGHKVSDPLAKFTYRCPRTGCTQ